MGRLPFDPDRIRVPAEESAEPPAGAKPPRAHSVTEVAALIRATLEAHLSSPIRVIGEVSNLSARNHWYFSLKDDESVLSCVAWASSAKRFGFTPRDGDEVVVSGHVSHYAPQGRTQFYVTGMKPVGAGALQQQFEALCRDLRDRGYFDPDHKVALPLLPRRIAVISSGNGAAIHDVIDTARRRCPAVGLLLVDVRVQGDGAAEEVAAAIRMIDQRAEALGVDAVLVTRGGGSMEDLWAFNERVVADATFACTLPIVAAIGHESDTTVIELVADQRAATPTQAAMLLVPSVEELRQQVDHAAERLRGLVRRRLQLARARLDALASRDVMRRPRALLERQQSRCGELARTLRHVHRYRVIDARSRVERLAGRLAALGSDDLVARRREVLGRLHERLRSAHAAHVARSRVRLDGAERTLRIVDPRAVLERGYSLTVRADGALVRSATELGGGDRFETHFVDGVVLGEVVGEGADTLRLHPSPGEGLRSGQAAPDTVTAPDTDADTAAATDTVADTDTDTDADADTVTDASSPSQLDLF